VYAQSQPTDANPKALMQPVRVIATTAPTVQTPHAAPENPQTGLPLVLEYYLQIASLGASQDANYMNNWERRAIVRSSTPLQPVATLASWLVHIPTKAR